MPGCERIVLRARIAAIAAVLVAALGGSGLVAADPAGAVLASKPQVPSTWTAQFCTSFVDWQAIAIDARDAALPVARTPVADRAGAKAAALQLDATLKPPTKALHELASTLERRPPKGKHGAEVGADIAAGVAKLAAAYDGARERTVALKKVNPSQFSTKAPRVLTKLDTDLDRAGKSIAKLEKRVDKSSVGNLIIANNACRRLGLEWSTIGGPIDTPEPAVVDPAAPGADDVNAPAVLLPGRYRPSPDIAALAARTTMTGQGRTFFYAAAPEVITGQEFASHCVSGDASTRVILGCYVDHRIYVLAVTRPELASVVEVTAAHEMLHAVYETMPTMDRASKDPLLTAFYDSSTDAHLRQSYAGYQRVGGANLPNELHSLIGTQVGALTPELETYYGQFFRNRPQVVAAFDAYAAVFDNLINRYHELEAQLNDIRGRIDAARSQASAAGGEANRLAGQIDALRAQGRIAESNGLVAAQNDAVRRANGFAAQGNALIGEYNALVDEINGIAGELGGLNSALRPLG